MGRRKFRLGRLPKNYDKPKGTNKAVGRPRKSATTSDLSSSCTTNSVRSPSVVVGMSATSTLDLSSSLTICSARSPSVVRGSRMSPSSSVFGGQACNITPMSSTPGNSSDFSSQSSATLSDRPQSLVGTPSLVHDKAPAGRPSMSSSDLSAVSCPSSMFSEVSSNVTSSTDENMESGEAICSDSVELDECIHSGDRPTSGSSKDTNNNWMKLLTNGLCLPNERWVIQELETDLGICKLSCNLSQTLVVVYSIVVIPDRHWTLKVHGSQVDLSQCSALSDVPMQLSTETLQSLLSLLDTCSICVGHPEAEYVRMAEARKGKLFSKNGDKVVALVDTSSGKTIRSSMCEMVVKGKKCSACVSYRNTLRKSYHRWKKQKSLSPRHHLSTSSKTNFRFLSTPEKTKRYSSLRARYDAKSKKVDRMKAKISALVKKSGVQIGSLSSDFTSIVHEMTDKVHEQNQEGTFRHLFWDEQIKALSKSDSRQIRWHPALIKWCLHLKFISSGAYHALRSSGVITLPSERTLRSYTHWIKAGVGFQQAVDDQLLKEMNINEEKDRYVVLCWDEVKVREGLIFDKHACELIGFMDLGDINNDLNRLEEECQSAPVGSAIATHMLLFMVRGMFNKVKFPYAHFATKTITADTLFPLVWEAVEHLEICGLNVIAFTSDGASSNRKFYKMHGSSKELVYKTKNPYREGQYIFFFSDVPHLIKTTRNCWSNSFCHKETRALWINGKHISWDHLVQLYKKNSLSGLSLLPKLTREHVYLNSYSRMRVNLAAQVLSASVAHALDYYGDDETSETRIFIQNFDRFFDCFNVRCISEAVHKRKPDLRPYRDPCDSRLTWLQDEFLKYLQDWEDSVFKRKKFTKAEMNKMLLSAATRQGIRMTVQAFVEMAQVLFSVPGVTYILSEKLCQDPLESFFGKQRAAGGRNDNPTVQDFCKNTVSLRVQGSAALDPIRGNCKRQLNYDPYVNDSTPLPKRPRKSK